MIPAKLPRGLLSSRMAIALLRKCAQRPSCRYSPKQYNELAPPHVNNAEYSPKVEPLRGLAADQILGFRKRAHLIDQVCTQEILPPEK